MSSLVSRYQWVTDESLPLASGYCVSLARGIGVADLAAMIGTPAGRVAGWVEVSDASFDAWEAVSSTGQLVAGLVPLGEWTMMFEINGFAGVTPEFMKPVWCDHEVVAHFNNINAVDRFLWWRDGKTVLDFEPLFLQVVDLPEATQVVARAAGFGAPDSDPTVSAFALAELLTGVALDPQFLSDAQYQLVRVPLP